jgi:hypothetical protein
MENTMPWSDELQEQTRRTLHEMEITRDLTYALKHVDGRFGTMSLTDVVAGRYVITDRRSGVVKSFNDAEALIRDGWVLD